MAGAKDLVPLRAFEVHPLNLNVSKWCSKPRNPTPFSEHWVRAESPYRRTFGRTLNPVTHSSACAKEQQASASRPSYGMRPSNISISSLRNNPEVSQVSFTHYYMVIKL
jgi:hypothetical protein